MSRSCALLLAFLQAAVFFLNTSMADTGNEVVRDNDGNSYPTVTIGTQTWLAENLRSIHYSDSTPIIMAVYGNDSTKVKIYGKLYTWSAALKNPGRKVSDSVTVQGACPCGWHVPTDTEWQQLADYLGGNAVAGGKMKMGGAPYWQEPARHSTNESGFSAWPSGFYDYTGIFEGIGACTFFLSTMADPAEGVIVRFLERNSNALKRGHIHPADFISLRCIKNPLDTQEK